MPKSDNTPREQTPDKNNIDVKKKNGFDNKIISQETPKPDEEKIIDIDSGNLIKFSNDERKALEDELYLEIKETLSNDSGLRTEINENHEIYLGVPPQSTESNSSHMELEDTPGIRSHYGTVAVKGLCSRYIASMFGIAPWITISLFDLQKQEIGERIQKWFQLCNEKIIKLKRMARLIAKNTEIENVGISSLSWELRTIPERGTESFKDVQAFVNEYPNAKESGVTEEEYQSYIRTLSSGKEVKIKYKKDVITYNFAKIDVINRSNFGLIPHNSTADNARGKFVEYEKKWDDLAKGYSEGRYFNIDKVKERINAGYSAENDEVTNTQSDYEGKSGTTDSNAYQKAKYRIFKILYSKDIDKDGLEEPCIFTFCFNTKTLIRSEYWNHNWFITPHYTEEKANRFEGIGAIQKVKPVVMEADEWINLRLKAGKLAVTPSFKARKGSDFDPGIQSFYPGSIWWMNDMEDVQQWLINVNFPEGYNEEASLERKYELLTSMTSGQSGKELPQDPNASGIKMQVLNREASIPINENIDTLRDSFEELAYNVLCMAIKYLPEDDRYLKIFGLTKEDLKISKEELSVYGTSLSHNSEQRKQDEMAFMGMFLNNPLVQMDIESVRKITADAMIPWGKDPEKLLLSKEALFQRQVDIQKTAMEQIQAEMKTKAEESEFKGHLVDLGLDPQEAEQKLSQWREIEKRENAPVGQETAEKAGKGAQFKPSVPL